MDCGALHALPACSHEELLRPAAVGYTELTGRTLRRRRSGLALAWLALLALLALAAAAVVIAAYRAGAGIR